MPNIWYGFLHQNVSDNLITAIHASRLFTHDPDVYLEPATFSPERFMAAPMPPDPRDFIFGFGRRICPGKLLADASVWLTIAKSLAALDIKGPAGEDLNMDRVPQFTPGVLSRPCSFRSQIRARTPEHAELIRALNRRHPRVESSAQELQTIEINTEDLLEPGRASSS